MPLKPLASAPLTMLSEISVTAANSAFELAVLTVFPRSPRYRFVPEKPPDFIFLLINLNMPAQATGVKQVKWLKSTLKDTPLLYFYAIEQTYYNAVCLSITQSVP
jgi:hypothetical protein